MRARDALALASKGLWRNRGRTALTVVAVALAAFTITVTLAVGAGVNNYLDRQVAAIGASNVVNVLATVDSSDGPVEFDPADISSGGATYRGLSESDIEDIATIEHVTTVRGFQHAQPAYIEGAGDRYQLSTQALMTGQELDIVAGSLPTADGEPQIAVTTDYETPLGCSQPSECVGMSVTIGVLGADGAIGETTARVAAVIHDSLIGAGRLWTNDSLQQAITDLALPPGMDPNYIGAVVYADSSDTTVLEGIKDDLLPRGFTGETIQDEIGSVADLLTLVSLVLAGFGLIALLAAGFGVVNTLYMAVQDRTREIGIMKAHGLSSRRIFGLFSVEASLIGAWGAVIGIGGAALAGMAVNAYAADTILRQIPRLQLFEFPLGVVLGVGTLILAITFLSGTLPARRAAQLDPIEALRYE